MAKKVEIVALVSVLGQPSYDKSRWANFFGEKLAKVTKGKDKIAAINAGASLFKKFVASIKDLDKQYSLKNVTVAAKALAMSEIDLSNRFLSIGPNRSYKRVRRRWSMAPSLLIIVVLVTVLAVPPALWLLCVACDSLIRPPPPALEEN